MGVCHPLAKDARPFVVTSYRKVSGSWIPDDPANCPWDHAGEACRPSNHSWRSRKTGPGHPLRVKRCSVLGRCYTLYPVGFTPYGRQPAVPVPGQDESLVEVVEKTHGGERWPVRPTAAADGSEHLREASCTAVNAEAAQQRPPRSTQIRVVRRAAALLGMAMAVCDDRLPIVARVLNVSTLLLRAQAGRVQDDGTMTTTADAVSIVLESMRRGGPSLFERMACAGQVTGLWGDACVCDGPGQPLRRLFRQRGTTARPRPARPPDLQRHH